MCKLNKPVIDVKTTASNIKACRIRAGFTVREIQSIFNFNSPQAIYNWESGKDIPIIDNLIVLAAIYKVQISDMIATSTVEIECDVREIKTA